MLTHHEITAEAEARGSIPANDPGTPPDDALRSLTLEPVHLADRFERYHPFRLRYVVDAAEWLVRDPSGDWRFISTSDAEAVILDATVDLLRQEMAWVAGTAGDVTPYGSTIRGLLRHTGKKPLVDTLKHRLRYSRIEDTRPGSDELLDADGWSVNLAFEEYVEPDPTRIVVGRAGIPLPRNTSEAACPLWEAFLKHAMPDEAARRFLQIVAGYSLTGRMTDHAYFVHAGPAGTGKSTFLDVLLRVFGFYGTAASPDVFAAKQASGSHQEGLARLAGKRLVVLDELPAEAHLAEDTLKQFAAGAMFAVSKKYAPTFEFRSQGKLHIATNTKVNLRGKAGHDRRMYVFRWETKLEDARAYFLAEFGVRGDVRDALRRELPGILAWCIAGAREHAISGLTAPARVNEWTSGELSASSTLMQWAEDCLDRSDPSAMTLFRDLWSSYATWCTANGVTPPRGGAPWFAGQLTSELNLKPVRTADARWRQGATIKEAPQ